jgi:beta-phosphoglucomutase
VKIRAAIFDLDGTLVDNMGFHLRAWQEISSRLGISVTAEQFERELAGRKNEEIFPQLLGRPVPEDELLALAEEKESRYRELYRNQVLAMPGAPELLEMLASRQVKLAVASAAPVKNRQMVLEALGWTHRFDAVVGGEGLRGKPAPDIFLAAAERIGVEPQFCVAFEDAVHGVASACAAGMRVAGILSTTPPELLRSAGAEWTARDFRALPAELRHLLEIAEP